MSTSTIVNEVNRAVLALWADEFADPQQAVRCPLLYADLESEGVLFVGCNPALPTRNHYQAPLLAEILRGDSQITALIEEERKARKNYPYFRPCHDIAKKLKLPWTHVDWFFQRGTNQRELQDEVSESIALWNGPFEASKFARKQITLSRKLMETCRPQIVLVANAFASKIAIGEFSLGSLDENGIRWADLNGRRVPVFLSGMLTGQRALDRGSRERLEWHMQYALRLIGKTKT